MLVQDAESPEAGKEEVRIYTYIYTAETKTILQSNYPSIKNKLIRKKQEYLE